MDVLLWAILRLVNLLLKFKLPSLDKVEVICGLTFLINDTAFDS